MRTRLGGPAATLLAGMAIALTGAGGAQAALVPAPGSPFPSGGNGAVFVALENLHPTSALDVLAVNQGSNAVGILSSPTFGLTSITSATAPSAVVTGTFDGGFLADAAVLNSSSGTIRLFTGNGDGTFVTPVTAFTPAPAMSGEIDMAGADFNGDGRTDLVVTDTASDRIRVFLSDGGTGFTEPAGSPYATGATPGGVAVGDLDGDGKADIVVSNLGSSSLSVFKGAGTGAFTAAAGSPFALPSKPYRVTIGDLDGDDRPDLLAALTQTDQVAVFKGDGAMGFAPMSGFPRVVGDGTLKTAIGDINGDGRPDLVVIASTSDDTHVLLAKGDGSFAEAPGSPFATGNEPYGLALGDIDADRRLDIAVSNRNQLGAGSVSILLNRAEPPITLAPTTVDAGTVLAGTTVKKDVTLTNPGAEAITVQGASVGGSEAGSWSVASDCGGSIAPGASCPLHLTFAPKTIGAKPATLTVTTTRGVSASVALTGAGDSPQLEVVRSPANFDGKGTSILNDPRYYILTLVGRRRPVTVTGATIGGGPFASYLAIDRAYAATEPLGQLCPVFPVTLAPGQVCRLYLKLKAIPDAVVRQNYSANTTKVRTATLATLVTFTTDAVAGSGITNPTVLAAGHIESAADHYAAGWGNVCKDQPPSCVAIGGGSPPPVVNPEDAGPRPARPRR